MRRELGDEQVFVLTGKLRVLIEGGGYLLEHRQPCRS